MKHIEKIQKYGVTEEQVNSAKNIIENDTFYSRESNSNIAQEIGYNFALTGSTDLYDNYLNKIKTVTVQDVNRVANKYLNKGLKVAIYGNLQNNTYTNKEGITVYQAVIIVSEIEFAEPPSIALYTIVAYFSSSLSILK